MDETIHSEISSLNYCPEGTKDSTRELPILKSLLVVIIFKSLQ